MTEISSTKAGDATNCRSVYKQFPINVEGYEKMMKSERVRKRANGEAVYYQDIYLPGTILKHVYVKDERALDPVNALLAEKGFKDVRVLKV